MWGLKRPCKVIKALSNFCLALNISLFIYFLFVISFLWYKLNTHHKVNPTDTSCSQNRDKITSRMEECWKGFERDFLFLLLVRLNQSKVPIVCARHSSSSMNLTPLTRNRNKTISSFTKKHAISESMWCSWPSVAKGKHAYRHFTLSTYFHHTSRVHLFLVSVKWHCVDCKENQCD